MKLGTETGSLVNHVYSFGVLGQPRPYLGMPVTMLSWTDRHPATVIQLFKVGKSIIMRVQEDNSVPVPRANPQYGDNIEYTYSLNPEGCTYTYKQNAEGRWCEVYFKEDTKRWVGTQGGGIHLGHREKYHDPHF
jgi:hypothetical protein